jgi:hypothetical protein
VVNDRDSGGKAAARTRGLPMCEESPNGGAECRLAGGEGTAVAHLGIGEKWRKGESFSCRALL